jgi:histidinol dehydrogenase
MKIRRLDSSSPDFVAELDRLLAWEAEVDADVQRRVRAILDDVRSRGDAAVLEYTRRFDRVEADSVAALEIPAARLREGLDRIPAEQREALTFAAALARSEGLTAHARSAEYRLSGESGGRE